MTIIVDHVGSKKEKSNGRPYRSFWIHLVHEGMFVTVKSCLYYVDTGTIQLPYFGQGISLVQLDPVTYKDLERHVGETFRSIGESEPTVSEKDRKEIQRKVKDKLKKGKKK